MGIMFDCTGEVDMKYTQEEIIKALKVIKGVCRDCFQYGINGEKDCPDCPFSGGTTGVCLINVDVPNAWEIKSGDPVWKALGGY